MAPTLSDCLKNDLAIRNISWKSRPSDGRPMLANDVKFRKIVRFTVSSFADGMRIVKILVDLSLVQEIIHQRKIFFSSEILGDGEMQEKRFSHPLNEFFAEYHYETSGEWGFEKDSCLSQ
jgi:hypothetical protein